MRTRDFERLLPEYLPAIQGIACKLTRHHQHLRDDVEQAGLIALKALRLPTTLRNPGAYIRTALKNRMISELRACKSDRYLTFQAADKLGWEFDITSARITADRRHGKPTKLSADLANLSAGNA